MRTPPTKSQPHKAQTLPHKFTQRHRRLRPLRYHLYIRPAKRRSSSRIRYPRFSRRNSLHRGKRRRRTGRDGDGEFRNTLSRYNPNRDSSDSHSNLHHQYRCFLSIFTGSFGCGASSTTVVGPLAYSLPPRPALGRRGFLNLRGPPIVCIIINSRSTL